MGKQHYMTWEERCKLEALREAGVPVAQIAQLLDFTPKSIYNELHRGEYTRIVWKSGDYREEIHYSADIGQQKTDYAQSAKGRPIKIGNDREYADFLEKKMLGIQEDGKRDKRKRFSPAAALAQARAEGFTTSVCTTTLYSYISKGVFLTLTSKDLWVKSQKKKQKRETVKRVPHPLLPNITQRPEGAENREEYGHWEMDLVVSRKGKNTVILTLTERMKREELIFKLPDRKAKTIRKVFDKLEKTTPDFKERFKSITTDNGSEFLRYDELSRSVYGGARFAVYYCHSYAAWEKGTVENHNRMIRRWFPKGTDFCGLVRRQPTEDPARVFVHPALYL